MKDYLVAALAIIALAAAAVAQSPSSDLNTSTTQPMSASAAAAGGVPTMYFGVKACGVQVFWLVMQDGRMFRLDPEHHPKDLEKFMATIAQLPHDLVEIPCATSL